jgi:hypothetical protein
MSGSRGHNKDSGRHSSAEGSKPEDREARALRFLEDEVWPRIPADQLGRRLTPDEEDEILGFGPEGV